MSLIRSLARSSHRLRAGGPATRGMHIAIPRLSETERSWPMSIVAKNLTKRFGSFQAVNDVSFEVPAGQLIALLGPSGSGKSTILRIIAGLEPADSGEVQLTGEDATHLRVLDRGVGFVFQHYAIFRHMSVRQNVAFGLEVQKRPAREIRDRVD